MPKKPWSGVYDATKDGENCAQFDKMNNVVSGSEDCLFLNVFTPSLPLNEEENELLPVMFFIHGGGFVNGSGGRDWFSPDFIVAKNTILVTINYRLGAFGFLCMDTPEVTGNAGLRDQNLAMKWVQKNIRAFNGNPDNVTIFGISAGSASVEYHLLSPMSKGLFHKAILQSGSSLNPWARTRNPKKLVANLLKTLDISTEDPKQLYKDLQNADVEKFIISAFASLDEDDAKNGEIFAFTPVVEKTFPGVEPFLNVEPLELLRTGNFNKVPTITGFVENEGGLFKMMTHEKNIEQIFQRKYIDFLPTSFEVDRDHFAEKFKETYKQKDDTEAADAFLSDLYFLSGIKESLIGRMKNNEADHYIYLFGYAGAINFVKAIFKIDGKGAYHGDDTTYLGNCALIKHVKPTEKDIKVRDRMVQMWTNFARTG